MRDCKFIRFDVRDDKLGGKPVYAIVNKKSGGELGQAFYYAPWKQWTARFDEDAVWSHDCLADVREFLSSKNGEKP